MQGKLDVIFAGRGKYLKKKKNYYKGEKGLRRVATKLEKQSAYSYNRIMCHAALGG